MSQLYPKIESTDKVVDSRQMLLDRDEAIKTNNSGPNAPTGLTVSDIGMSWFNTQDNLLYVLTSIEEDGNNPVWQKVTNFSEANLMTVEANEELLYIDLNGPACLSKNDMIIFVNSRLLESSKYNIAQEGIRVIFVEPIEMGSMVEIRWLTGLVLARDGATFVPKVEDGILSWDNDKGLPNPETYDFKIPQAEAKSWAVGSIEDRPEGSAKYWAEKVEDFYPIGAIIAYPADTPPDGWLVCNGASLLKVDYPELFAVIGTKYGNGEDAGGLSFSLPNFVNRTFWGGISSGTVKAAGLPNITGTASGYKMATIKKTGAFSGSTTQSDEYVGSSPYSGYIFSPIFDASKSNSIYGKSSTVQPPALQTLIIIKY